MARDCGLSFPVARLDLVGRAGQRAVRWANHCEECRSVNVLRRDRRRSRGKAEDVGHSWSRSTSRTCARVHIWLSTRTRLLRGRDADGHRAHRCDSRGQRVAPPLQPRGRVVPIYRPRHRTPRRHRKETLSVREFPPSAARALGNAVDRCGERARVVTIPISPGPRHPPHPDRLLGSHRRSISRPDT